MNKRKDKPINILIIYMYIPLLCISLNRKYFSNNYVQNLRCNYSGSMSVV